MQVTTSSSQCELPQLLERFYVDLCKSEDSSNGATSCKSEAGQVRSVRLRYSNVSTRMHKASVQYTFCGLEATAFVFRVLTSTLCFRSSKYYVAKLDHSHCIYCKGSNVLGLHLQVLLRYLQCHALVGLTSNCLTSPPCQ